MRKPVHPSQPSAEPGLEYWYVDRRTLADFRRAPLGPYFDGFAASLKRNGYRHQTGINILSACCIFNDYLIERGITAIADVSEALIDPFLEAYFAETTASARHQPWLERRRGLKHLFLYLADIKVVVPPAPKPVITPQSWILDPYVQHLHDERELAVLTINRHRNDVLSFLTALKDDVHRSRLRTLRAERIDACLKEVFKTSTAHPSTLASSLRYFLSYCAQHDHTRADFSGLVPRVRQYRHSSLPRGIEDSAVDRIIKLIDRNSAEGARDYAIILLLMAYGIRAISVCRLVVEDIDWAQSKICFRAQKGGKEVVLPLLDAVAEAIIAWLRHRDPRTPHREVFLSTKAPHGPLTSVVISKRVQILMQKAGVHQPGRGAHTLRHSWAIRALGHDQPIKAIADVLGHRYIDTTYIYAKADLKTLRQVAMPWPKR
jgi:site-specific recombinase XerD